MLAVLVLAVLFLAYANGANDNLKGVATLLGSRTTNYKTALIWATMTTFAGSVASVVFAQALIRTFSGKGLVEAVYVQQPQFLLAVALGAALTVMIASRVGLPISTTHAMTGALVGAGIAVPGPVDLTQLGSKFFLPLALSPFIAFALTSAVYLLSRWIGRSGFTQRLWSLCVSRLAVPGVVTQSDGSVALRAGGDGTSNGAGSPSEAGSYPSVPDRTATVEAPAGLPRRVLDRFHFVSAGAVGFARGMNDTPKVVALIVAARVLEIPLVLALLLAGVAMAVGGLLHSRRVSTTMSEGITTMNPSQGLAANLTTAFLVIFASRWGVPVSTTHVSCGSIIGVGTLSGGARWTTIRTIFASWLGTLPLAALLAWLAYAGIH